MGEDNLNNLAIENIFLADLDHVVVVVATHIGLGFVASILVAGPYRFAGFDHTPVVRATFGRTHTGVRR